MSYFENKNFEAAKGTVVGTINNIACEDRWKYETPVFAKTIISKLPHNTSRILDYGCGIGRLSKELLKLNDTITIVGVDSSLIQLNHAQEYVCDERFSTSLPHLINGTFNLIYAIYVLQHVKAVDIRQVIEIIHAHLAPNGVFIHCSSHSRMSVRTDIQSFFDDRFLGVTIEEEILRLFDPVGELFDETTLRENDIVRRMVQGDDGTGILNDSGFFGEPHPAKIYRPKIISKPYFMIPLTR